MTEKELVVFICEDDATAREIVSKYLEVGKVTYAEFLPKKLRPFIIKALKEIEAEDVL